MQVDSASGSGEEEFDTEEGEQDPDKSTMIASEPLLPKSQQQNPPFPSILLTYLYAGHFLARWGARFLSPPLFLYISLYSLLFYFAGSSLILSAHNYLLRFL